MNSVRERLLRILIDRLRAALAPAPVLRQPATPLPREAGPVLLVFVEGDALTAHANRLVDRSLTVRLVALARGADAFDAADRLIVAAHAAVLADPNLGGLALAVRELGMTPLEALAAAMKDNADFVATILDGLAKKQDKLGYTPINKAGDTLTGVLPPLGGRGQASCTASCAAIARVIA